MNNIYPKKIIDGFVEVFPNIKREDAVPVLEKLFGLPLEERDADEFLLFEGKCGGVFYQLQLNYDWNLDESEKQSIGVHVQSSWEERENISDQEVSELLRNVPSNVSENEYGNIVISGYIANIISSRTGYRCLVE